MNGPHSQSQTQEEADSAMREMFMFLKAMEAARLQKTAETIITATGALIIAQTMLLLKTGHFMTEDALQQSAFLLHHQRLKLSRHALKRNCAT